jgi:hypothetical protein
MYLKITLQNLTLNKTEINNYETCTVAPRGCGSVSSVLYRCMGGVDEHA